MLIEFQNTKTEAKLVGVGFTRDTIALSTSKGYVITIKKDELNACISHTPIANMLDTFLDGTMKQ